MTRIELAMALAKAETAFRAAQRGNDAAAYRQALAALREVEAMAVEVLGGEMIDPLNALRSQVAATGFRVVNRPRIGYQPKKYPWRVEGPDGSCWSVRATEREALLRALSFAKVRRRAYFTP